MKVLFWLPRILAIFYILFLAIFALDVFIPGESIFYYIAALFMHLIPNLILTIALVIAWKKEKIGGGIFILISIFMFWYFHNSLWVNILIFGPVFLTGALFIYSSYQRK